MPDNEKQEKKQLRVVGESWTNYLNYFQNAITHIILDDVINSKVTDQTEKDELEAKADLYAKQYFETIKRHMQEVFINTALSMDKYLNSYQVYPKDGDYDEFKGIYFTGMVIAKHLEHVGLLELKKIHLKAVLGLMDFRLDNPLKCSRKLLTERIISMIDNDKIHDHMGMYGWYITYKCLYNSANERANADL